MTNYKRQIDLFNPALHEDAKVVLVGAGNIGSHTALALTRMGIKNFTLVDFDIVEEHNLSSQAYSWRDNNKKKIDVLESHMLAINTAIQVQKIYVAYQNAGVTIDADTILVSAVDSMHTRKAICEMIQDSGCLVVDGRMGGGQIEVHAQRASEWGATLVDEADSDPCGARYISYTSYIIAGLIANTIKRHLQGQRFPSRILLHCDTLELIKTYPHAGK